MNEKIQLLTEIINRLERLKTDHDKEDDYHRLTYAICHLYQLRGKARGESCDEIVFRKMSTLFNLKRTAKLSNLVNIYMTPYVR